MSAGAKCRGIFGAIFGHKWKINTLEHTVYTDHCTRCGFVPERAQR